jgi:hypothetical protein
MPLDGEEHARAEHENLERNKDYRDPIHLLSISRLLFGVIYREGLYVKTRMTSQESPVDSRISKQQSTLDIRP